MFVADLFTTLMLMFKNLNYVNSVNPLYLLIKKIKTSLKKEMEINICSFPTDKNKDTLKPYADIWNRIKDLIKGKQ